MLPRPVLLVLSTLALLAAGCITPDGSDVDAASLAPSLAGPDDLLWLDPENAPHPGFGWPTLVSPPRSPAFSAWWQPIEAVELPASIAGIEPLAAAGAEVESGGGIAIFGGVAVVPGFGPTSHLVDIRDPLAPVVVSEFEPTQGSHRGAAIVAYPDGRVVTALSTGLGFELWDITDPAKPVQVAAVEAPRGGHKLGIVPGTPILYNANSNGGGSARGVDHLQADKGTGATEIYDLTDPASPVLVQEFPNGFGCHHIYFWNSAEKQRAICAGIEFAQIWDTADPLNPVVIVSVPIPHGNTALPSATVFPAVAPFAHFSILNAAGTVLVVGDELGGGLIPPGCTAPGAPTGALWFYDVSDETSPQLLGWYSPGHHIDAASATASCTAHHGRLVPDPEGRDLLAMAFYGAGVVLLDFSDPSMPKMIDQWYDGSNTWEAWYYNGYIFTGDLNRGLDVIGFV